MREILFRAKTAPNCKDVITGKIIRKPKWIYGYIDLGYMHDCGMPLISEEKGNKLYKCQYETIGQYTGVPDKKSKKIFEGDIVKVGEHSSDVNGLYKVIYCEVNHCWALERAEVYHYSYFTFSELNRFYEFSEVISNIHDSPEILKGGA